MLSGGGGPRLVCAGALVQAGAGEVVGESGEEGGGRTKRVGWRAIWDRGAGLTEPLFTVLTYDVKGIGYLVVFLNK